jgi:hypothetical protein
VPHARRESLVRALALAFIAAIAAACSAIRFEEEPQPPAPAPPPDQPVASVAGAWAGFWEIEGQRIQGTLTLRQDRGDLQATFASSALGSGAAGTGRVAADGSIALDLRYNIECPGTAQLDGDLMDRGGRLDGTLVATDCTGKANGTFSFSRR